MTSAADLFGLQEIDINRDVRRALIADIDGRLGEPEELIAARQAAVEAKADLDAARRQQRELETQVQDLDAKINPLEEKLYGGSVRNPKELTDMQHELERLKGLRGELDDQGLAIIEQVEAANRRLAESQSAAASAESAWVSGLAELRNSRERAEREMASLDDERQRRVIGMDASLLGLYDILRAKKQGRAVAQIQRGTCLGCRLMLPSHVAQKTRSALNIVQCPSCERILVGG